MTRLTTREEIRAYARELVANWPPVSEETLARLAALLPPPRIAPEPDQPARSTRRPARRRAEPVPAVSGGEPRE